MGGSSQLVFRSSFWKEIVSSFYHAFGGAGYRMENMLV